MDRSSSRDNSEDSSSSFDVMWMIETATECDCPGPPPEFMLPPPPRPPILQPSSDGIYCTDDPLPMETCDALPLIDASYRSSPSFQTSAVIVLCSVLVFVFIGVILVWKHKRKVQNFLPCKTSPQNCDGASAPAAIYEDLHDVIPRTTPSHHHSTSGHIVVPSIELEPLVVPHTEVGL